MLRFSAHEAKQRFGEMLMCSGAAPVEIMKYKRRIAVVLSAEDYDALKGAKTTAKLECRDDKILCEACNDENIARGMLKALPRISGIIDAAAAARAAVKADSNEHAND